MTIQRNLLNYPFSKDYKKLYELAKKQSVVCVLDHLGCRDVCQTIYIDSANYTEVVARGICYIFTENEEEFISHCEHYNLEWIIPNDSDT